MNLMQTSVAAADLSIWRPVFAWMHIEGVAK